MAAPAPLLFHLGAAAAILAGGAALAPLAADPRFPWTGVLRDAAAELAAPPPVAVLAEATTRLAALLSGIAAWRRHPHRRRLADPPVLWRREASRLLDFGGSGPTVLAIPSLVNRAYILDLAHGASLMRYLAARGLRTLLLDWGVAGPGEAGFGLDAYHAERLAPALAAARDLGGPVALLGYCMGGTLAAAAAQLHPGSVSHLALIGAPWDHSGTKGAAGLLRGLARGIGAGPLAEALEALDRAFGSVPWLLLQTLFALLDPGLALAKFRRFAALDPASPAARRFVETEDWLNDPAPLPGPAARELLIGWQVEDLPARGLWRLGGEWIDPGRLRLPALAICPARDRIAPPASTEPLARAIPGARILRPPTGHVGAIVGSRAPVEVWEPLAEFLAGGRPPHHDVTG